MISKRLISPATALQAKSFRPEPGECDRRTRRCGALPNGSSKKIQESANEDTKDGCEERGRRKQGGEGRSGPREGAKGKSRFGNSVRGEPGGDRFVAKRVEEVGSKPAEANPGAPSTVELQAQLDDARRQRDSAEREKVFLSETIRKAQERSTEL